MPDTSEELTDEQISWVKDCISEGAFQLVSQGPFNSDDPVPDDLRYAIEAAYDAVEDLASVLEQYEQIIDDLEDGPDDESTEPVTEGKTDAH